MGKETSLQPLTVDTIKTKIYEFRGQRVMLDKDLADLYQVETKRLKESVKRNIDRFPEDAMFQLTESASSQKEEGERFVPRTSSSVTQIMASSH